MLGLWDYWKHPENLKRVKEYLFLFGVTAATMAYGVVHDYGKWLISRDYYSLAKGIPMAEDGFEFPMVRLAMLATWNVGLIGRAILLLSNNPDTQGRHLGYWQLLKMCVWPLVRSVFCEITMRVVFYSQSVTMPNHLPI